jgi:uncharacterized protein
LDAIGAIGIARCFTFGGRFGRPLYDPEQPPRPAEALTREAYMQQHSAAEAPANEGGGGGGTVKGKGGAATLNHFHEKLLTLKGRMKTASGRALAEGRHAFMEAYLEQFGREIAGDA